MSRKISRRQFVTASTALGVAAAVPTSVLGASEGAMVGELTQPRQPPAVHAPRTLKPLVVSDIRADTASGTEGLRTRWSEPSGASQRGRTFWMPWWRG